MIFSLNTTLPHIFTEIDILLCAPFYFARRRLCSAPLCERKCVSQREGHSEEDCKTVHDCGTVGTCDTLQPTATSWNALQHIAPRCTTLHYAAPHCNIYTWHGTLGMCVMLQHAATCCNTLQNAKVRCNSQQYTTVLLDFFDSGTLIFFTTCCNTLQHTTIHSHAYWNCLFWLGLRVAKTQRMP